MANEDVLARWDAWADSSDEDLETVMDLAEELAAALREAREDTKRLFQALDDATGLISLAEHAWEDDDHEKAGRVHDVFRSFYAAMKTPGGEGE